MATDDLNLAALKRRDEVAWSVAFGHLWPKAKAAALRAATGFSDEDAEDAAMQALAELAARIDRIESIAQLEAWAVVLAHRRSTSAVRCALTDKRGRHRTSSLEGHAESGLVADAAAPQESDPPSEERCELSALLIEVLSRLDPKVRELLIANICEGMSFATLSEMHGISRGTIASQLSRAMKKIRTFLGNSPKRMQALREFLR